MDAKTKELRAAHDVLAEFYAGRLAGALDWLSPDEMERQVTGAGFAPVFWGGRPAEGGEGSPQGYLLSVKAG
jgi:hypothetical protein